MHKVLSIFFAIFIAGCSLAPQNIEVDGKFEYRLDVYGVSEQWWEEFGDERLNSLINAALKQNSDLLLALNAIEQARINLRLANLELLPNINLSADASKNRGASAANSVATRYNSFNLGAALNYEIDLWGRVRNSANASEAAFVASGFDYKSARLSIASAVASSYFTLISLREQENILNETLATYKETLQYRQNQFDAGVIDDLILHQSSAQVFSANTQLLAVQSQISQTISALAVLIGSELNAILYDDLLTPSALLSAPNVPEGISSDILAHRGDIAAAKKRLEASNYMIGVARASWLPKLSLTGLFGFASRDLDTFFNNSSNMWNVGGSVVMPLLDFGRTYNSVELANLQKDAALINYDKTVKTAFGEIRSSLETRKIAVLKEQSVSELVNAQQVIYDISKARFEGGYSTHLDFLDAQRQLLAAKLSLAQSKLDLFNSVVAVFKSLGGGFSENSVATSGNGDGE